MSNQRNESNRTTGFRSAQSSSCLQNTNKRKNDGSRKRFTMASDNFKSYSKKRRKDAFVPPTHFLLGGNIHDPLNLKSIKTNDPPNASSSDSESLSGNKISNKEKVDVLIPPNIQDPLNLAHSESLNESDLVPITSHNKRNKRQRTSSESEISRDQTLMSKGTFSEKIKDDSYINQRNCHPSSSNKYIIESKNSDKIVSPVVRRTFQLRKNYNKRYVNCDDKRTFDRKSKCNENHQQEYRDSQNSQVTTSTSKQKQNQNERFQYGNYNRYYGYRNIENNIDPRIEIFRKDLFENKDVLDIGCNVGHVTLTIARDFSPRKIVGIDIDQSLIQAARKNVRHYVTKKMIETESFPLSLPVLYGSLECFPSSHVGFPNNVTFVDVNYVPISDECLQYQKPEFDTILCLSLTKWIHLNWGDAGLKRMFKRIFLQLRPAGCLILEPQPWSSYHKKSKITPKLLENFRSIRFKPEHFHEFLLKDVGFRSCELLGTPTHNHKGFQRPIYLYKKKDQ